MYASWEESTAPQRAAAELAQAELDRRGTTRPPQLPEREPELAAGEPTPVAEPESQAEAEGLDTPEAGREDLAVEATAGDLEAAVDQLPELDTTSVSPATEARTAELAARKTAQAEAAADEAQRKANQEAYAAAELASPEPEAPSAQGTVSSSSTPSASAARRSPCGSRCSPRGAGRHPRETAGLRGAAGSRGSARGRPGSRGRDRWHALAALLVAVLAVVAAACWAIADPGRARRLTALIRAWRGTATRPAARARQASCAGPARIAAGRATADESAVR